MLIKLHPKSDRYLESTYKEEINYFTNEPFKIKAKNQVELQRSWSQKQKDTRQDPKLFSSTMMKKLKGNTRSLIIEKGNWEIYNQNIFHRNSLIFQFLKNQAMPFAKFQNNTDSRSLPDKSSKSWQRQKS